MATDKLHNHPSLGDVLIVSGDEGWAASIGKMLNDNLYETSVALNGDQIIERLIKHTWYHLILIDLDSIDVFENYLIRHIRKIEPDVPIIGLGSHKKPLTVELIRKNFLQAVSVKETKVGRKTLTGLILACCIGSLLWVLLFWIWK
jgi:DNA-binding NtrC family response regulator